MSWFLDCFTELPDPRHGNAHRHDVLEFLTATLCGTQSCVDFELFARSKERFLREFLTLEGGIPSHDTFSRPFRLIDPDAFATCLARFAEGLAKASRQDGSIALDGKGLGCALARVRSTAPMALVDAVASANRLTLGFVGVPQRTGKIDAARTLLGLLDLDGRTVPADAMHCQRETAQAIQEALEPVAKRSFAPGERMRAEKARRAGADDVLGLKANRFAMDDDAVLFPDDPAAETSAAARTLDVEHGRGETRRARVVTAVAWLAERYDFPGLQALGEVTATREEADGTPVTRRRPFALSRGLSAEEFLATTRVHWGIENRLYWVLDAVLDEDRSLARTDNAPLTLAMLRRRALNIARANPAKGSIRGKLKRTAWDDTFLTTLIAHMR